MNALPPIGLPAAAVQEMPIAAVEAAVVAAAMVFNTNAALLTIGFLPHEAAIIAQEAFPTFESFRGMTDSDVTSVATEYSKRTVANGKITFGFNRTKMLTGLMHWVQDQWRMGMIPDQEGPIGLAATAEALSNADIRKNMSDNQDTASKAADPGK